MQPSASTYVRRTYAKGHGKHKWSMFANSSEGSRARRKARRAHLQPGNADRSSQSTPPLPLPPPPVQPLIPAPPPFVKGTGKRLNSSEGSRARRKGARDHLQPGIADRSGKSTPPSPPCFDAKKTPRFDAGGRRCRPEAKRRRRRHSGPATLHVAGGVDGPAAACHRRVTKKPKAGHGQVIKKPPCFDAGGRRCRPEAKCSAAATFLQGHWQGLSG